MPSIASLLLGVVSIVVSSQADFDRLPEDVRRGLAQKPAELTVTFEPGTYHFKDDHLLLQGLRCPETRLVLEGNGAILVGTAPGIRKTPFYRSRRPIEVLDAETKLCRIRTRKRLGGEGRLQIQVTSWYRMITGTVTETKAGYVYFTADDLNPSELERVINGDYTYGKQPPRFRLVRVEESDGPYSSVAFNFTDCSFREIDISGFTFDGNAGRRTDDPKGFLIRFYACHTEGTSVRDCVFRSIRTDVIRIAYSERVGVRKCRFEDCARIGVLSYNHSEGTSVVENDFVRMGTDSEVTPCVKCQGTGYLVAGNRFVDYGCCAVMAGLHFSEQMIHPASGVIERNEIYQTPDYRKKAPMNLLMDTGAIYVKTQNESVEIRDNVIHDISGPRDNRGIFCDDGTVNAHIHDNTVLRIANSYCIDLRLALSVETRPDSYIRKVNVGNRLENNQVDGKIRFEQR